MEVNMSIHNKKRYSGIGGQAVLDGIMMKKGDKSAVSVRKTDGEIITKDIDLAMNFTKSRFSKLPFIRGVYSFIESMMLGMKSLNYSAEISLEEEEEPGKFEQWLQKKFGDKSNDIILNFTMILAVALGIGIFMLLPLGLSSLAAIFVRDRLLLSVIEALTRVFIFVAYILAIGQMDDIKKLYQYHGAEHKCISCLERGKPLTVHNVVCSSRLHPRCGTSFLLYVVVISCILFFFIQVSDPLLKIIIRLLLVPVIAGISFEIIRFAGKFDNLFTNILSAPGLMLQKLTTKEPDKAQVEVAITAVEAVFDWKNYLRESFDYKFQEDFEDEVKTEETSEEVVEEEIEEVEDDLQEIIS